MKLKKFHLVKLIFNKFGITCGLILITARVTTTCGDELVKLLLGIICDAERPFMTLLLLLNKWLRQGGLSDPMDPSQPKPDPEESESVDV